MEQKILYTTKDSFDYIFQKLDNVYTELNYISLKFGEQQKTINELNDKITKLENKGLWKKLLKYLTK